MREISGLARQITPLRLLLNPSPASSLYILSTLISKNRSRERYYAVLRNIAYRYTFHGLTHLFLEGR
ncbi:hypothetical protein ALC57_11324 [Trachymyrmex cornetzi]|uniref:Uncharacterized protein n=1 Tax=Trachymyrmex cornetzi TaxID=471704 RepID=A0A195DV64_9HYME|nr:hypothetical protein ALC57_11324 [Trachymyrmex cornetzi]